MNLAHFKYYWPIGFNINRWFPETFLSLPLMNIIIYSFSLVDSLIVISLELGILLWSWLISSINRMLASSCSTPGIISSSWSLPCNFACFLFCYKIFFYKFESLLVFIIKIHVLWYSNFNRFSLDINSSSRHEIDNLSNLFSFVERLEKFSFFIFPSNSSYRSKTYYKN